MNTRLEDSDWTDSHDDSDGSDWERFLSGPDDDAFEQNESQSSFSDDDDGLSGFSDSDAMPEERNVYSEAAMSAFCYALENKDYLLLRRLLEKGFPVDSPRHCDRTALMRSAYIDDYNLAKLLLEFDANPYAEDCDGDSPIRSALRINGKVEILLVKNIVEYDLKYLRGECSCRWLNNEFEIHQNSGRNIEFPVLQLLIKHNLIDLFSEGLCLGYDCFGEYWLGNEWNKPCYVCFDSGEDFPYVDATGAESFVKDFLFDYAVKLNRLEIASHLIAARANRLMSFVEKLQTVTSAQYEILVQKNIRDNAWLSERFVLTQSFPEKASEDAQLSRPEKHRPMEEDETPVITDKHALENDWFNLSNCCE